MACGLWVVRTVKVRRLDSPAAAYSCSYFYSYASPISPPFTSIIPYQLSEASDSKGLRYSNTLSIESEAVMYIQAIPIVPSVEDRNICLPAKTASMFIIGFSFCPES